MTGKRLGIGGALIALVVLLAGCGNGGADRSDQAVVRIALEAPLTGEQASNGIDMFRGARLAVDQANQGGGVLGRRLELIRADDRADPQTGQEVAREVADRDAFAVVGPYNSNVGVENLDIYLDEGVIPIHLTSNSDTNGQGFTVQPKDYQIAPIEAEAIAGFLQARDVAIVYDPQTYTQGIAEQLRDELDDRGVDVIAYEETDPDNGGYGDQLERLADMGPDVLYASTYYPQGAAIATQFPAELGGTCLMGLANQDPGFVEEAGLESARRCTFSGVPSADQFPGADQYVEDYRAAFGTEPGTWGSFTYDSVNLLLDAVERAGGWEAEGVERELAATQGFQGITGTIDIDPETGNRVDVPVVILDVTATGGFSVNPRWSDFAGFGL